MTEKLAPRRDLHDGRALWHDSRNRVVATRQLQSNVAVDIAIVGGGISGALTALVLSAAGHQVAVFDRREPGSGSTVASTAMIQFEIDTPLIKLAEKIGRRNAERAYLRSFNAVRGLGHLLGEHNIDARWRDRSALYLAGAEMGFRGLQTEVEARTKIRLPSQFLSGAVVRDIYGIDATGAILSEGSAELDPATTAAGCLRAAKKFGAVVYSPCEIVNVSQAAVSLELLTADGMIVKCAKLIFATGYEIVKGVPRSSFDIVSSWAIATKPIDPAEFWHDRCLIWEASDPYLYLRTTADNRIVAGGEDSGLLDPARRQSAIPNKSAAILRKVQKLLNRADLEIDYAWAGAFAESPTGLPFISKLDMPGTFGILGCGGNGITFSFIAAGIAKAWVEGKTDPDADLFRGAAR